MRFFYKIILIILIVFLKTGNVLSDNNVFNVNNIELIKKSNAKNKDLANEAIKKGFKQLIEKILLEKDKNKLVQLNFSQIKDLVLFYQLSNKIEDNNDSNKLVFNISFDKDKIHNLFFERNISYSEITNREIFILPILKKNNQIFIYNQNFFYTNWNEIYKNELIEFILPLENIEVIRNINLNIDSLLNVKFENIFDEISTKNVALVFIEDTNSKEEKIYFKINILGNKIIKNKIIKRLNFNQDEFYEKITTDIKKEIVNIIKSQNLIDVKTPSFLNAQLENNMKNNLASLNERLKKINLIENIYVQEFNNKSVFIKIKYLGKLSKIIKLLEEQNIILQLIGDQWSIKII